MFCMADDLNRLTRREFTALSVATGVAAGLNVAARASTAAIEITDLNVRVTTADGICEAALLHPAQGAWPGVILFTDVFGLRRTTRDMAHRLATAGFTVLVPNPFYRTSKAGLPLNIDFNSSADRARIDVLRAPLTTDAVMRDASAYVRFLDAQRAVDRHAMLGALGYCMGGAMTIQAAAANPERIGAAACFHGGGLVTEKTDSPHRLIAKMAAQCYCGISMNDHRRQPDGASQLKHAFDAANLPVKVEVYDDCLHGWCIKDMPAAPGKPAVFNALQAERAWVELENLFAVLRTGQVTARG